MVKCPLKNIGFKNGKRLLEGVKLFCTFDVLWHGRALHTSHRGNTQLAMLPLKTPVSLMVFIL